MATRAQRVRLALFLLFSVSVLGGFLLVVAGSQLLLQRLTYYIEFDESVGGLTAGDPVKYQGITVGRVEDTRVSAEKIDVVVVEISLEARKVPNLIRADTQARLYSQGVTGLKYIELSSGSPDAPLLEPGAVLPARATFMSNMEERAEALMARIEGLLTNLTEMTAERNQRRLGRMIEAGSELMENTNDLLTDRRGDLDSTVTNLARVTGHLEATTASMRATMDSIRVLTSADETRAALRDLSRAIGVLREHLEGPVPELLASLNQMTGKIDATVTHVDRTVLQSRKNILDAMQSLEETLLNVRQATELIRENPAVLLRGRTDP